SLLAPANPPGLFGMVSTPAVWKSEALTVLPVPVVAPIVTRPLGWLVNPLNVTGVATPAATVRAPPLAKLTNWSDPLLDVMVAAASEVTWANRAPGARGANGPAPPRTPPDRAPPLSVSVCPAAADSVPPPRANDRVVVDDPV